VLWGLPGRLRGPLVNPAETQMGKRPPDPIVSRSRTLRSADFSQFRDAHEAAKIEKKGRVRRPGHW
jgi:hypothetical protein